MLLHCLVTEPTIGKTPRMENLPLYHLRRKSNLPPSSACQGNTQTLQKKQNLGYVMTKLVDDQRHVLRVLSNMPGACAVQQLVAYLVPSKLSPEPSHSPPGQLTAEFFSWNILLLYGDTMTEGTLIF